MKILYIFLKSFALNYVLNLYLFVRYIIYRRLISFLNNMILKWHFINQENDYESTFSFIIKFEINIPF